MKHASWTDLVPSLLLAAGILISTAIAVATSEFGWWVMTGPLVMAITITGTSVLGRRRYDAPPGTIRLALLLGAALIVASALVALRDPANVVAMLPVLGACVAAPLGMHLESEYQGCSATQRSS